MKTRSALHQVSASRRLCANRFAADYFGAEVRRRRDDAELSHHADVVSHSVLQGG
jgi:hypothetical protein